MHPRQTQQCLPLSLQLGQASAVIEKHVAAGVFESKFPGHVAGQAPAAGAAIDEIQIPVPQQPRHQPAHTPGVLGQATAHMVIHASDIGYRRQRLAQGLLEAGFRHVFVQPGPSQVLLVHGFHRQVQHDLAALAMGNPRQAAGIGGVWNDTDRDIAGQVDDLPAVMQLIADIIDDDGDVRARPGCPGHTLAAGLDAGGEEESQQAEPVAHSVCPHRGQHDCVARGPRHVSQCLLRNDIPLSTLSASYKA